MKQFKRHSLTNIRKCLAALALTFGVACPMHFSEAAIDTVAIMGQEVVEETADDTKCEELRKHLEVLLEELKAQDTLCLRLIYKPVEYRNCLHVLGNIKAEIRNTNEDIEAECSE